MVNKQTALKLAVFLLNLADFSEITGLKKVTLREFVYWTSFIEPAITELILLRYKPKSIGVTSSPSFFIKYENDTVFPNKSERMNEVTYTDLSLTSLGDTYLA